VDQPTRSVRRASGFVLVGNPETGNRTARVTPRFRQPV